MVMKITFEKLSDVYLSRNNMIICHKLCVVKDFIFSKENNFNNLCNTLFKILQNIKMDIKIT